MQTIPGSLPRNSARLLPSSRTTMSNTTPTKPGQSCLHHGKMKASSIQWPKTHRLKMHSESDLGYKLRKIKRLQRHDRECGDLYGCLPLIHGMPVATTDHIDRSPDTAILRGRIGYVHSWVLHAEEESSWDNGVRCLHNLPPVVFVKYPGATWVLPGL